MPALARARRAPRPQQSQGFEPLRPIEGRKAEVLRRFVAKLSSGGPGRTISAPDFLQAALTYAEDCPQQNATTLNVAVTDAETGETHCFRVVTD